MKRVLFVLTCVCVVAVATSHAAVVASEDFESYTLGQDLGAFYNGAVNAGTSVGTIVAGNGGQVAQVTASISDPGWVVYGFAINLTASGNTSTDLSQYTLEFDFANVSGAFDPMNFWSINATVIDGSNQGKNYEATVSVGQADGYVHMSIDMGDFLTESWQQWWGGSNLDMTDLAKIELRGAQNADDGHPLDQVIAFDNVQISIIPEPATMVLLGLGSLAMIRKRK